ncbi:BMP family lipoprotein [Pacificibacter marinus]|uniref:Membrane lipoprotein TmpC n=1 Tax=Pacificibacter marinus TaxID=658057 RepID=A0A1Y5SCX3_9RHOB|nr:BMP family ABC transporter substrate-binding protein [Pacificibacter marinus]SEK49719.1 nucleoside-binding protein [Pacificibacter marinus]SLN37170.1 Membrane lipoprotein TmpC precursor [Pacificibacter marinus]
MTLMKSFLGAAATLALTAGAVTADPAIIFDLGGKFDKSFNESAYEGAERWAKETGGSYRDVELTSDAQREQALRRFAESGYNPVVMAGFSFATALETVAADYPDTKFAIIDMVVDAPNVRSVVFSEHEGSYLVGVAAAYAAKGDTVSFVGGMDIPLISKFACGYAQGFKSVKPEGKVIVNMTGTTPAAWNDPVKGGELTRAQKSAGSEVVFAAAGGTGLGVLQTAKDEGMLAIGVDSNQNYLQPGTVLTSMVKRVDNAVFDAFTQGTELESGINVMDLSNAGVSAAMDENNASLITEEMKAALADAEAKIISGEVVVHDYMSDESCPAY